MITCKCGRSYKSHDAEPKNYRCPCGEELTIPPGQHTWISKWPAWAKAIAIFRKPEDVGIGDTFHRLAERFGAEWVIKKLGINCGCKFRREQWNEMYCYETMPA